MSATPSKLRLKANRCQRNAQRIARRVTGRGNPPFELPGDELWQQRYMTAIAIQGAPPVGIGGQTFAGYKLVESRYLIEWNQTKFPKSKKLRMRVKWMSNARNYELTPMKDAFVHEALGVIIAHPDCMRKLIDALRKERDNAEHLRNRLNAELGWLKFAEERKVSDNPILRTALRLNEDLLQEGQRLIARMMGAPTQWSAEMQWLRDAQERLQAERHRRLTEQLLRPPPFIMAAGDPALEGLPYRDTPVMNIEIPPPVPTREPARDRYEFDPANAGKCPVFTAKEESMLKEGNRKVIAREPVDSRKEAWRDESFIEGETIMEFPPR